MLVDPKKTRITMIITETQNRYGSEEETVKPVLHAEPNREDIKSIREITEQNLTEAPCTIDDRESLTVEPTVESVKLNEANASNTSAITDTTDDMTSIDQEPLNVKFLKAVEKTRAIWDDDRQFRKIVQKMQKGKNLKRKEFDKVHSYLREYCQHH